MVNKILTIFIYLCVQPCFMNLLKSASGDSQGSRRPNGLMVLKLFVRFVAQFYNHQPFTLNYKQGKQGKWPLYIFNVDVGGSLLLLNSL